MRLLTVLLLFVAACDAPASSSDAGSTIDAGSTADAGSTDAGPADAGHDGGLDAEVPTDAGDADGGAGDLAGTIEGACGVLDDELTDTTMSFAVRNTMTFAEPWTEADTDRVSEGAREILSDGTAGGSSGYSEAFAFEVLHRCEGAALIKSETEIEYDAEGGLTDILVEIDGMKIGVSVTRAVTVTNGETCTRADTYATDEARRILTEKLESIAESSMNVTAEDAWVKQILFVFADTAAHADVLRSEWDALDSAERDDTVLFVSVSEGEDDFIYFQRNCP